MTEIKEELKEIVSMAVHDALGYLEVARGAGRKLWLDESFRHRNPAKDFGGLFCSINEAVADLEFLMEKING